MPYNGSGTYAAPASTWNPAVTNTAINSTDWIALLADLTTALSTALCKDGQSLPTANIPMGGFKLTGLAAGTVAGNALRYEQLFTTSAVALLGAMDWVKGADIVSAATINLTTATGNAVHVTGATPITAVTLGSGLWRMVVFDGALTLTHHTTNNNLPTAANITTAAGDRALYWSDGTTVYCMAYVKANGRPLLVAAGDFATQTANTVLAGPTSGGAATPTFRALVGAEAGMVLLGTATASGSATVDFTSKISSTYDTYIITLTGVTPATDAVNLQVRLSTDNGSTFLAAGQYYIAGVSVDATSQTVTGTGGDAQNQFVPANNVGNGANQYTNGTIRLERGASVRAAMQSDLTFVQSTGPVRHTHAGCWVVANAVDAIRFLMSSGNIATGEFAIYGLRKA